jgi:hypothetical protein
MSSQFLAFLILITTAFILSACATPQTVLRSPRTGQVEVCGGSTTGFLLGGKIGQAIQEENEKDCVRNLKSNGFTIIKHPKE